MRDYKNPYPTVDIIIEMDNKIILIERRNEPYGYALPGGFIDYGESAESAAIREAKEETSLDITDLRLLGVYSEPDRDKRFHTISTVYIAKGRGEPLADDDAKKIILIEPEKASGLKLCFDHDKILYDYLNWKHYNILKERIFGDFFENLPVAGLFFDKRGNIIKYNKKFSISLSSFLTDNPIIISDWLNIAFKDKSFRYSGCKIADSIFDIYLFKIDNDSVGCMFFDVTDQAALADELANFYIKTELIQRELEVKLEEFRVLYDLSKIMLEVRSFDEFYEKITNKLNSFYKLVSIGFYGLDDKLKGFKKKYSTGAEISDFIDRKVVPDNSLLQVSRPDIYIPIYYNQKLNSVLFLKKNTDFKEDEIKSFITIAGTLSLGIANLILYIELRDHNTAIEFLNKELQNTVSKLESINRAKTEFIQTVSHEMRGPLTSIKSYTETLISLLNDYNRGIFNNFLSIIKQETDRLTRIITTLLDLQRIEVNKLELRVRKLDIIKIIDKVLLTYEALAAEKKVSLIKKYTSSNIFINGDEDRIVQVLTNLVSNAIKYNRPAGNVGVDCYIKDNSVHISVSDTGIGIAENDRDKIFESFTRIETGLYTDIESSGLGLSITKKLVELHNGRIEVKSKKGEGSTFTIILPLAL
ncbi:MAG: ATP-binding protein [Candidatus Hydrogenedentota bacterium]